VVIGKEKEKEKEKREKKIFLLTKQRKNFFSAFTSALTAAFFVFEKADFSVWLVLFFSTFLLLLPSFCFFLVAHQLRNSIATVAPPPNPT